MIFLLNLTISAKSQTEDFGNVMPSKTLVGCPKQWHYLLISKHLKQVYFLYLPVIQLDLVG